MDQFVCPFAELKDTPNLKAANSAANFPLTPRYLGPEGLCEAEGRQQFGCCNQALISALILGGDMKLAANGIHVLNNPNGGDRLQGCLMALRSFSANNPFTYFRFRLRYFHFDPLRNFRDSQ